MDEHVEAHPLHWPAGWTRSRSRTDSSYQVNYSKAAKELLHSLKLMGATGVVVSTNVPIRLDGLPYADQAERLRPDPGVAVYFMRKGKQQVIACDKWKRVRENIRAVGLCVDAMRQMERGGASELLDRAFMGFKALAAPGAKPWRSVLGLSDGCSLEMARRRRRELAMTKHPDL